MIRDVLDVSLTDYPKHVASVLFYGNCTMRCPFCYNYKLLTPQDGGLNIHDVKKQLKENMLIDGVVATGGEPLLSATLPFDFAMFDDMGLDIKLDTNGTMPHALQNVMILLDYIAMDVKSNEQGYKLLGGDFNAIKESVQIIMDSGKDYEFRCTAVEPFLNEQTAWDIGDIVSGAKRFYIQRPKLDNVLYPHYPMGPTENLTEISSILESFVAEVFIR